MKREIITTKDGSKTIHLPEWNENYHSYHGAYQEAMHVFIKSGLNKISSSKKDVSILEMGFGTGLNTLLTLINGAEKNIHYSGIEAFPVSEIEIKSLDYTSLNELKNNKVDFLKMHQVSWNELHEITPRFHLLKIHKKLLEFDPKENTYDIIYFDAFGPRVQPELWDLAVFKKLYNSLNANGVFVTYCCKGQVRRDLITAGFEIEKIPGPPGKREMLRGWKR